MVTALGDLNEAARDLSRATPGGCQHQVETLGHSHVLALVAAIQDVRKALGQTEAYLVREVGRDGAAPAEGRLPDGRAYVLRKGATRKAWDHEEWRKDVRRQVLSGVGEVVDPSTGESVDVAGLLAAVQQVHGAGAPKVVALKGLGLDPGDYCETFSGPWGLQVTSPE